MMVVMLQAMMQVLPAAQPSAGHTDGTMWLCHQGPPCSLDAAQHMLVTEGLRQGSYKLDLVELLSCSLCHSDLLVCRLYAAAFPPWSSCPASP